MAPLHLPQEIVTEIIYRLPLRWLLRCKLLSKQWKNLISDPNFYTRYKDISRTAFFRGRDGLYCVSISGDNKAHIHGPNVPSFTVHRLLSLPDMPNLIGSSHGIACLEVFNGPFFLYNWFTGSLQTVAKPPRQERCSCLSDHYYGFGYDYYSDDYKIFVGCKRCPCPCWIYSYRSKEWNSVKGFPYEVFTLKGKVAHSFNGVLHWALVTGAGDNGKEAIVTYDLHTNIFGEIQGPPLFASSSLLQYRTRSIMSEVDGQLCHVCKLVVDEGDKIRTDVWVMKEYGVGDSWERFTIRCDSHLTLWMKPTTLLYKLGDGGFGRVMLFVHKYGKTLIWCNIDNNKVVAVSTKKWQMKMMKSNKKGGTGNYKSLDLAIFS